MQDSSRDTSMMQSKLNAFDEAIGEKNARAKMHSQIELSSATRRMDSVSPLPDASDVTDPSALHRNYL